jgi:signal transduction histidine kinase/CheY-like chemotaxis protein
VDQKVQAERNVGLSAATTKFERWLFAGALVPVLFALTGDAIVQGISERRLVREGLEAETRILAHLSAGLAEAAVEFDDTRALEELLEHVSESKAFVFVSVHRADGTRLVSRSTEPMVRRFDDVPVGGLVHRDGLLVLAEPIGRGPRAARLVLGMSTHEADERLRWNLLRGLTLDAVAISVSMSVMLWLVRQHFRRQKSVELQREMLRQTGRMAKIGGWELRLPVGGFHISDEAAAVLGLQGERAVEMMKLMAMQHRALITCVDTGAPFDVELEVPVHGERRWMRVQGEADRLGGKTTRVYGAVQDVTEQRQTREAALAASRAKSQFLANTSHEIRTPLNGILGMTELALEGPLSLEQRGYLESVRQSGKTMLAIINDLLDISRIESGRFTIEAVPIRVDEVVSSAARALVAQAHQKGLELVVNVLPEVALHRVGDPLRLTQIVTNLVGNALKFTERGEVEVQLSRGAADDELVLSVRDTGVGIPAARLDAIFEAFTQSDGSTTRRYGGTGLGLTISRELSRLMGGDVRVSSVEGQGSTFTATLRLGLVSGPVSSPSITGEVLLLEARDSNARATEHALTRLGATTRRCTSLDEVEAALNDRSSLAVFLDSSMEGALELRERLEARGVDAVMLVPFGIPTRKGRSLARPLLTQEVAAALAPKEAAQEAAVQRPSPARKLKVLLAEDNAINATVARRLVERAGHEVTHVWNGQAAVASVLEQPWDLVLMDVQMPELDGLEATRRIRAQETVSQQHVPIYAMTANAMGSDQVQCLAAGMDGFLTKPVDLRHLNAVLEALATKRAA